MSVFQRILGTTSQITRNSERERLQRERRDRERMDDAQSLRDRNVLHEMDEANRVLHEQNRRLRRESDALRQRLAELEQHAAFVVRQVADLSETWRRTAEHLRLTWGALLPDVCSDEETVCDIADAKEKEVQGDAAWQHQRDAYINECFVPALISSGEA